MENKIEQFEKEELAIIDGDVHFGLRDVGRPVIWFGESRKTGGSLQVISGFENIERFLCDADCYDIKHLSGKPIIVEVDNGIVKFKRFFKHGE